MICSNALQNPNVEVCFKKASILPVCAVVRWAAQRPQAVNANTITALDSRLIC